MPSGIAYNPQVVKVTIEAELDGQQILNSLWWAKSDSSPSWTQPEVAQIVNVVGQWTLAELATCQVSSLAYRRVRGQHWVGDGGFYAEESLVGSGTNTDEPLPNNVAVCVSASTGKAGRGFHGRFYVAGVPGTSVDGNSVLVSYRTDLEVAFGSLITGEPFSGFLNVVYSQVLDGAPRLAGVATPVLQWSLRDLTVDSQRRRLPGRGR